MERIIKIGKTLRNNWKKSTVGAFALYYAAATAKERYEINILMQAACKEAVKYGDALIPMDRNPTTITVILNPVANKRKAKQEFEKYCEPLLHLAGLQVEVIQTTSEGNAKEIVETLRGTEAIIVAGGDGTLSETVTGLLRRNDGANQFPLGVLPLGRTNTLGNTLFPGGKGVEKVKQLIEASMAIIKGNTVWKDAMKIEPIAMEEEVPNKPIYALTSVEWRAFRDTLAKRDKYWIYGPLRDYMSFIFNGYKESLAWACSGMIKYTPPCEGCSNCMEKRREPSKRWLFFIPNTYAAQQSDRSAVENPECLNTEELCFKTCDFKIQTPNIIRTNNSIPSLQVKIGKNNYSYTEFVAEGWKRLNGENDNAKTIPVRTVEFRPRIDEDKEITISIDQEEFEAKPVKITLLPKVVKLFCKQPQVNISDE
ncbi:acylglycerol kinase, mitochondrial [Pectinophora gossypiella]|uniref:acylglycerol kinase, mitochondrial n=1 Tax=Pectinophora gossypiella TaxID=13191 RepID=UPI00214E9A54|nr:acylglycerol kinase, mitochondrial [Pectinophora gossypiella]